MKLFSVLLLVSCMTALAFAESDLASALQSSSSILASASASASAASASGVSASIVSASASAAASSVPTILASPTHSVNASASPNATRLASSSVVRSPSASASPSPVPISSYANDLRALKYIYVFEKLESTFLNETLALFNETDFTDSGLNSQVHTYLRLMATHETTHYMTLAGLILMRNETLPASCNFTTGNVTTVEDFIFMASAMQDLGVSAYTGLINRVYDPILQEILATIATVEARHATWLNTVKQINPFPEAFDTPLPPKNVTNMLLEDFVLSCPFNLTSALPLPRNETVVTVSVAPPASTSAAVKDNTNSAGALIVGSQLVSFSALVALIAGILSTL